VAGSYALTVLGVLPNKWRLGEAERAAAPAFRTRGRLSKVRLNEAAVVEAVGFSASSFAQIVAGGGSARLWSRAQAGDGVGGEQCTCALGTRGPRPDTPRIAASNGGVTT
jgi:hypothetical protein